MSTPPSRHLVGWSIVGMALRMDSAILRTGMPSKVVRRITVDPSEIHNSRPRSSSLMTRADSTPAIR
jgi:hypothetical protein